MCKQDFLKGIKLLESCYRFKFSELDLKVWYSALKEIPFKTFTKAIGILIKTSKFMPSIAEILKQCESVEIANKATIVESMKKDGYFKNENEYQKILGWLSEGIIPKWFQENMNKYLTHQKLIVEKNTEGLEERNIVSKEFNEK